jgi:SAM-dependent methyltransferase
MRGYGLASYGDSYDDTFEERISRLWPDPTPMVKALARYAGGTGPALELGVGSGRIARPLAALGVETDGIEVSPVLAEQLRRSADGLPLQVIVGDFGDMTLPRKYRMIYAVLNSVLYLTTREKQVRALDRIVRALDDGGVFVMESFTPDPQRFTRGQEMKIVELAADEVTLQFSLHYPDTQIIEAVRVYMRPEGLRFTPTVMRYVSMEQLDEMAAEVGLRLRGRFAGWNEEPFTGDSRRHVSVFEAI